MIIPIIVGIVLIASSFFTGNYVNENILHNNKVLDITVSPTPEPSLLVSPSPSPISSPSIQANRVNTYIPPTPKIVPVPSADPDPLVHCQLSANCGGGTIPLKQSECNNSVCCQIRDKWVFYKDKSQCIQDQKDYEQTLINNLQYLIPSPPSFVSYPPPVLPSFQPVVLPSVDWTPKYSAPPSPTIPYGYGCRGSGCN